MIQKACDITEKGFKRVLGFMKPGVMEYEVEAEFIHEFIRNRSAGFAYTPILGSGYNACVFERVREAIQRLFSGPAEKPFCCDVRAFTVQVECDSCGEVIAVRIDRDHEVRP